MNSAIQICRLVYVAVVALVISPGVAIAQSGNTPQGASSAGSYRIAGIVVSKGDGNPLARSRVVAREVKRPDKFETVITAEDGRFEFTGVPAGKYSLTGAKRGFISAAYDQHDGYSTAIVTGAGIDTENLVLKLSPDAVISGEVMDEAGDPVRHASVMAYVEDHSEGMSRLHMSRAVQTNDLGEYEVTGLMPGTYFLSSSARPWYAVHRPTDSGSTGSKESSESSAAFDRSLDVAYPVTYYADVTDADSATPISIRGGEHLKLDVHLNPVPSLHLVFHAPGNGISAFGFPIVETPAFDGAAHLQTSFTRTLSGAWEIAGIPAGRYNIQFSGSASNPGSLLSGVTLTKDGEEIDPSAAQALSSVKVTVQLSGEATAAKGLTIGLRGQSRTRADRWNGVDSKGTAEFNQIPAGKYEVVAGGSGAAYSISQLSADGAEVSGHVITIGAGTSASLSITLTAGSAEVQGAVKKAGKPFAGAMVVLVPQDAEGDRDLFRRDQSDLDGTFVLHRVIPGPYTVVAIENGWDLNWGDPSVIAGYAKHGQKIKVDSHGGRPLVLEDIVVQPK
jgi:Carboxypeptidase regulatory-like domain